jgi:hypothetical protein
MVMLTHSHEGHDRLTRCLPGRKQLIEGGWPARGRRELRRVAIDLAKVLTPLRASADSLPSIPWSQSAAPRSVDDA